MEESINGADNFEDTYTFADPAPSPPCEAEPAPFGTLCQQTAHQASREARHLTENALLYQTCLCLQGMISTLSQGFVVESREVRRTKWRRWSSFCPKLTPEASIKAEPSRFTCQMFQ